MVSEVNLPFVNYPARASSRSHIDSNPLNFYLNDTYDLRTL